MNACVPPYPGDTTSQAPSSGSTQPMGNTTPPTSQPAAATKTTSLALAYNDVDVATFETPAKFAEKAATEYAAKTGMDASKVTATAVAKVSTSATFKEDVSAAEVTDIYAGVTGWAKDKITVTASTRRLSESLGRRLQDKMFNIIMEVADKAAATDVIAKSKDTAAIVTKAKEVTGKDIAAPTVAEPKMKIDVSYVVQGEVAAPTAEQ